MNEWISVKDRLPDGEGDVIFITDDRLMYIGYYDDMSLGWTNYEYVNIENVTHWMPLPKPPEEAEDD